MVNIFFMFCRWTSCCTCSRVCIVKGSLNVCQLSILYLYNACFDNMRHVWNLFPFIICYCGWGTILKTTACHAMCRLYFWICLALVCCIFMFSLKVKVYTIYGAELNHIFIFDSHFHHTTGCVFIYNFVYNCL